MYLKSIFISGFRNIETTRIDLNKGVNIFLGLNAQGKTNLLEAIGYLLDQSSFRGSPDNEMLRFEENAFHLGGKLEKEGVLHQIEINYKDKRKKVLHNEKRAEKKIGSVVVFSPDDLTMIKGGPEIRRRLLDRLLGKMDPDFNKISRNYRGVLYRRNMLLKNRVHRPDERLLLSSYTDQIIPLGLEIIKKRITALKKITPIYRKYHLAFSAEKENLDLTYQSSLEFESGREAFDCYKDALESSRERELGSTEVGPHRDDFCIYINKLAARRFASQGQVRTLVLAYKRAEVELITDIYSTHPLLLLDDVFSELDSERVERFALGIDPNVQLFVTATELPPLFKTAQNFKVEAGRVTPV